MKTFLIGALALLASPTAATAAAVSSVSYTGIFAADNDKRAYTLNVGGSLTLTLRSFGYAGGVNGAGATIARGGFDPIVSLYGPDGQIIDFNDDGAGVPFDAVTGQGGDSLLSLLLTAPGNYTIYLTQYDNFGPANLSNPFNFDGQPNFRGGFIDANENQRTGAFALDISTVPETPVWMMMIAGFGLAGAALRRRRSVAATA